MTDLYVGYNDVLESLSGLDSVTAVRNLRVVSNPGLTSLSGLGGLTSTRSVYVAFNGALTSLSGSDALTSVELGVTVLRNPALCDQAVEDLLAQLIDFDGVANLRGNNSECP